MKKLLDKFLTWYNEPKVLHRQRLAELRKMEEEIAELRFRIDKMSNDLVASVYEKGYPSYEAVNRKEEQSKAGEMDDIKAKLLGKR